MRKLSTLIIVTLLVTTIFCFPTAADAAPEVSVPSAILVDQATGTVLFEKNADEQRAPASVTKVMTLLLIMEALQSGKLSMTDSIPVSANAAGMGGSQVYLKEGETMTVDEMLKCIAVVSANDCCVAMAEAISGSVESFIETMNQRAAELGMANTHFNSCTGLDTDNHYTCARDIAVMSRELMKHPEIQNYTTIWMDSVRDGAFSLSNTNKLVRFYEGATGLKTGFTSTAGYCLSATATRESMSLVAVVLGGETSDKRFEDAKALLNFGFSQYGIYSDLPPAPDPVNVIKGLEDTVNPVLAENPAFLVPKGAEKNITYEVVLPESVMAPVEPGQKLGTITYTLDGQTIGTINLMAEKEVPKVHFGHLFFQLVQYFFVV
ncbi:MAG: D-alanyl-D-alanine carboxypeptidase [Clostridiales bacterium]|nr:MAG: D-alanyl-D-alanine carboxypeptidase [Clostridiales bacterium]